MSGKLIMKRKLDRRQNSPINDAVLEGDESSATPTSSTSALSISKQNKNKEDLLRQGKNKRVRCDTPPPEPNDFDLQPHPQINEPNRNLLQAIQLKILELQNELDAFESDVEAHEEEYYCNTDLPHNRQVNDMSEEDAEAVGFAMCAQETMLFLQREGIPSDSLMYTRLRDALIGRTDRMFHL